MAVTFNVKSMRLCYSMLNIGQGCISLHRSIAFPSPIWKASQNLTTKSSFLLAISFFAHHSFLVPFVFFLPFLLFSLLYSTFSSLLISPPKWNYVDSKRNSTQTWGRVFRNYSHAACFNTEESNQLSVFKKAPEPVGYYIYVYCTVICSVTKRPTRKRDIPWFSWKILKW